uniref:(northern house mosquito) hypothetical protein n=1 Tax=Culex pipiens TaxID=7175 RepID=A0A8D8G9B8_CULPI
MVSLAAESTVGEDSSVSDDFASVGMLPASMISELTPSTSIAPSELLTNTCSCSSACSAPSLDPFDSSAIASVGSGSDGSASSPSTTFSSVAFSDFASDSTGSGSSSTTSEGSGSAELVPVFSSVIIAGSSCS